ncbi:MAG TPA: CopG family transcriptional regulator [Candidatus Angelobacter sp.]
MKKTRNNSRTLSAEAIARRAEKGKDVSRFFTHSGRMMPPVRRVNVDFSAPMLEELDRAAVELNISRQAVIKTLVRHALDHRYLARKARPG